MSAVVDEGHLALRFVIVRSAQNRFIRSKEMWEWIFDFLVTANVIPKRVVAAWGVKYQRQEKSVGDGERCRGVVHASRSLRGAA